MHAPTEEQRFLEALRESKLLAILRDAPDSSLIELARVLRESRIGFVEVTMNSPGATRQIERLRDLLDGHGLVGAGTVLTRDEAHRAVEAGATFLVSPCLSPEVQAYALEHRIPSLPGAMSPQEIWNASRAGATMVKLFPAGSVGGPSYVKALRGPFKDIPLLACGGVNSTNAREFLRSGADALAFGGSIFAPSRLREGDFDEILKDLQVLRKSC